MRELDSWNPMAEDYACPKFNSYNNSGAELDECSLYIKNVACSLSKDAFVALMSENGRKVIRAKLLEPRPNQDHTIGLVAFEDAKDAAEVMKRMNKTPPWNMIITYAHKKRPTRKTDYQDDSSSYSYKAPPPVTSNPSAPTPPLSGKGRGSLNALKFPALRIVLDGEKRTSFTPHSTEVISSPPSDIPKLVENPFLKCLACDNVGKFSCATCKKPYCSSTCQMKDWPQHKLSCVSSKRSRDSSYVSESSGSDSEKKSPPAPPKSFPAKTVDKQTSKLSQVVKIKDIQTEVLPKDKQIKVKVSHIINPSKFWIQPSTAMDRLSQMEKDLALYSKQTPSSYDLGNVYCINRHGMCKRVAILEVKGDKTALVQFLDYGNMSTVPIDQLFLLPNIFKEMPYQAVQCKLGDIGQENDVTWSDDDTACFQMHSSDNKSYAARVLKQIGDVYVVNLSVDEGISLYSIISGLNSGILSSIEVKEVARDTAGLEKPPIPSVWSSLKNGDKVTVVGVEFGEDEFWGILDDGSGLAEHLSDLDTLLASYKTPCKDYNSCAEEGDVVAGFSLNYQVFYRCVVLKRMRDRFLVRFIDYGNTEEITQLCELTPELLKRCCYIVCCSKPDSLSQDEFKTLFSGAMVVSVNRSKDNSTKLSFLHKNHETFLNCFPWYHDSLQRKSETIPMKPPGLVKKNLPSQNTVSRPLPVNAKPEKISNAPPTHKVVSQNAVASSEEEIPEKRITSSLIADLPFVDGNKHCVKVVFIVHASKIFLQFQENELKLQVLSDQLNKHCSLMKPDKYSPIKNEIVCCKYKEDGNWYRGEVIGKQKNVYKVFFIDYGNEDNVTNEEMKPLPSNFSSHKFALCASLHNISNEDLKELIPKLTSEFWNMKVLNKTTTPVQIMLYQKDKPLTDYIKKKAVSDLGSLDRECNTTPKPVALTKSSLIYQKLSKKQCEVMVSHAEKEIVFVQKMEDEKPINDLNDKINVAAASMAPAKEIFTNGVYCALFSDGLWYRVTVDKVLPLNRYLVTFIDFGNQETIALKNLKELPEEFFKFPVFGIPVIPQNIDVSEMQQQVKYSVEVSGEKSGAQLVTVLNVPKKAPSLSSIKKTEFENGVNEALISHFEGDLCYCLRSSDIEDFADITEKLQDCPDEKIHSEDLSIGSVVCVKSSDGCWCRGAISKILSRTSYEISLIDFGISETISLENIKRLPENFLKYPLFSVPCRINNFEKAKEGLVNNLEKEKKDIVLKKALSLKTVGKADDGVQIVEVLIPKSPCGVKVSSLKKQLLPVNETVEVSVCHIEGSIYYCQQISDQDNIKSLESKLISASAYESLNELPEVGCVVCAKFSDNIWYRGSVEEICRSSNSCKICFIDYGNTETISIENIKMLPSEMNSFPIFSIPVHFRNLEKLQKLAEAGACKFPVQVLELSAEGIQEVKIMDLDTHIVKTVTSKSCGVEVSSLTKQFIPVNETVEVSVCHIEGDIYYCQLISDQDKIKSLESKLISASVYESLNELPDVGRVVCAKFSDNIWYRGSVEEFCRSSNSCKICFIDYGNTETINLENIKILPSEINSFPIFSIPVHFKNLEKLQELAETGACKFPVQVLESSAEGFQVVKIVESVNKNLICTSIDAQLLSDLPTEVTVCYEESGVYYVQKVSDKESMEQMMSILQGPENVKIGDHTPQVGEILSVKCSDGLWYRGMIKQDCRNGSLKVFFVDYGNTEEISKKDMRFLPSSCAPLPMFSIPVKLSPLNKHTTCLSVDKKYTVKRTATEADNVQMVKVRPCMKQVFMKNIKSSLLEENLTFVTFQSSFEDHFFLTKCSDANRINEMNRLLKDFNGEEIFDAPVVDEILIVKGADKNYYRGCIKATNVNPGFCRVFLVDKGSLEDIPYSNIYYMPEELSSFPLFSIKVLLSSGSRIKVKNNQDCIVRVVSSKELQVPTVQVVDQFMINLLEKKHLPLQTPKKVMFCYRDGEVLFLQVVDQIPLLAELFKEVQSCSLDIIHKAKVGELLVAQSSLDSVWYRCCVEEMVSCDSYKVNYIDYGNSEVVSKDKMRYFDDKLFKYPSFCIPVKIVNSSAHEIILEQEYTVLAENLPISNEPQLIKLVLETAQQIPASHTEIVKSSEKSSSIIEISSQKYFHENLDTVPFPDGDQDFIIFSVVSENYVFGAPCNMKNMEDLTKLSHEITEYCKNLTDVSSYEGEPPMDNEMVLAHFEGEWFRAAIVDAKGSAPKYEVLFVDYGNSETLTLDLMRRMKDKFMLLDIQAHLCKLTGFQFKQTDSAKVTEEIKANFVYKPLTGLARKVEEEIHVQVNEIIEHLKKKNLVTS